jgi:hypothetical protein
VYRRAIGNDVNLVFDLHWPRIGDKKLVKALASSRLESIRANFDDSVHVWPGLGFVRNGHDAIYDRAGPQQQGGGTLPGYCDNHRSSQV